MEINNSELFTSEKLNELSSIKEKSQIKLNGEQDFNDFEEREELIKSDLDKNENYPETKEEKFINLMGFWNTSVAALATEVWNQTQKKITFFEKNLQEDGPYNEAVILNDIKNSDAFETNNPDPAVRPNLNYDLKKYYKVRADDLFAYSIENEKNLQFTREKKEDSDIIKSFGPRLIMPMNVRRVEIEDLNRNFWVISQSIAAICEFLFDPNDRNNLIIDGLSSEIVQLWENVLYLWINKEIINKNTENTIFKSVIIQNRDSLSNEKYSYYTVNEINDLKNEGKLKSDIINKLQYLRQLYPKSNLCILPILRVDNYKQNYYSKVYLPGILFYDRKKNEYYSRPFINEGNDLYINFDDFSTNLCAINKESNKKYFPFSLVEANVSNKKEPFFGGIKISINDIEVKTKNGYFEIDQLQINLYDDLDIEENQIGQITFDNPIIISKDNNENLINYNIERFDIGKNKDDNIIQKNLNKGFYIGEIISGMKIAQKEDTDIIYKEEELMGIPQIIIGGYEVPIFLINNEFSDVVQPLQSDDGMCYKIDIPWNNKNYQEKTGLLPVYKFNFWRYYKYGFGTERGDFPLNKGQSEDVAEYYDNYNDFSNQSEITINIGEEAPENWKDLDLLYEDYKPGGQKSEKSYSKNPDCGAFDRSIFKKYWEDKIDIGEYEDPATREQIKLQFKIEFYSKMNREINRVEKDKIREKMPNCPLYEDENFDYWDSLELKNEENKIELMRDTLKILMNDEESLNKTIVISNKEMYDFVYCNEKFLENFKKLARMKWHYREHEGQGIFSYDYKSLLLDILLKKELKNFSDQDIENVFNSLNIYQKFYYFFIEEIIQYSYNKAYGEDSLPTIIDPISTDISYKYENQKRSVLNGFDTSGALVGYKEEDKNYQEKILNNFKEILEGDRCLAPFYKMFLFNSNYSLYSESDINSIISNNLTLKTIKENFEQINKSKNFIFPFINYSYTNPKFKESEDGKIICICEKKGISQITFFIKKEYFENGISLQDLTPLRDEENNLLGYYIVWNLDGESNLGNIIFKETDNFPIAKMFNNSDAWYGNFLDSLKIGDKYDEKLREYLDSNNINYKILLQKKNKKIMKNGIEFKNDLINQLKRKAESEFYFDFQYKENNDSNDIHTLKIKTEIINNKPKTTLVYD